jgi:hypothetical protein
LALAQGGIVIFDTVQMNIDAARSDIQSSRDIAQGTSHAANAKTPQQRLEDEVRLLRLGSERLLLALEELCEQLAEERA